MSQEKLRFALAGNPNCGKTTLFNSLTGSTAYVGNWPGVTVEKRSGTYKRKGIGEVEIIDLPGIYSLSPYTPEEVISRNYILEEKPDVVINVLDATNLERNLYMTTQILEMDVPVVVALNMSDALKEAGQTIDVDGLSKKLGVPVISISALRNSNLDDLMKLAIQASAKKREGVSLWAKEEEEKEILKAAEIYQAANVENARFHAIKALEGDELEAEKNKLAYVEVNKLYPNVQQYEADSADRRYKYITGELAILRSGAPRQEKKKLSKSDRIDKVLTNKWAAIPFMVVIIFLIFHLTFGDDLFYLGAMGVNFGEGMPGIALFTSDALGGESFTLFDGLLWSDAGINTPGGILTALWGDGNDNGIQGLICVGIYNALQAMGSPDWLLSFIYDGVLNGISAVLGYVPQILVLFAFFSILEDSGYMARIAFVLDRIFRRFGVSGRAFLPMIMGFGCAIPAMINTRTLSSDKERTKTIRVIPFFTCGAKAEFLIIIAAAIAGASAMNVEAFTFLVYMFGVVVAITSVIVMNHTTQREKVPPFIMELPAYHLPQAKALFLHVWDRGKHYLKKAFTIIFASTVIIWFLSSFTPNWMFIPMYTEEAFAAGDVSVVLGDGDSILAHIGMMIAPIFTPMGFGNVQGGEYAWTYAVASIQGIVAKENVVAILEQLASLVGGDSFADIVNASNAAADLAVRGTYISNASLAAFAVFNMTTIPCFASVATAKGELASRKDFLGTLLFWVALSYALGCLTYVVFEWYEWGWVIPVALIGLGIGGILLWDRHIKAKAAKEAIAE